MLTVAGSLARGHKLFAQEIAVRNLNGTSKTYAELGREARQLVAGLYNRGLLQGDRVVVLTQNRPECFTIDHALAIGGLVRVALSYRLHPKEVAEIVADCEARAIFVDGQRIPAIVEALIDSGCRPLLIGLDGGSGVEHYASLFGPEERAAPREIGADDMAWMPYTSGTTGRPKGVMHSHRSLMSLMRNILVELPGANTSDVLLHVAPLTHLSGYAMLAYFLRGASQIAVSKFDPETTLALIEQHKVTVLPLVPTMLHLLLPQLEERRYDVSSIHTIMYGGSPIAPDRLARSLRCLGPIFLQSYGLTEYPWASWMTKNDHKFDIEKEVPSRLASAGRVSPFVELRLVKPDGADVSDGEAGEIHLRGDGAMCGYWNRPQETSETILPGGWVATGDVGRLEDGFIHIVDRKKEMIVSGGFNIYPTEVENAIYEVPGVLEVAVIGVPSSQWGETVKALIVVREGYTLGEEDITAACLVRLANYKRPRCIEFVESLPKTGTGKIMRRAIKERYWAGRDRQVGGA